MSLALPAGARIGILGGGQLGRMLALAAADMGFDVHVFEPEEDCPAARVSARHVSAPWHDLSAVADFARGVDVVTFEWENVPTDVLDAAGAHAPVRPGVRSLELTQDRLVEKRFVRSLGLATADFEPVHSAEDIARLLAGNGGNAAAAVKGVLKTRRLGYDGKGQARLAPDDDPAAAWAAIGAQPAILESWVDFACEVSVVAARGADGSVDVWDVTANTHSDGILRRSIAPAAIGRGTQDDARAAASAIIEALDHIGVLAVEFFVLRDGGIVVNEIAPRVHNSGHWTLGGAATSQFANHVRAIAGWPLGPVGLTGAGAEMVNLLGDEVFTAAQRFAVGDGWSVHLYGKRQARPGRKMGHATRRLSASPT